MTTDRCPVVVGVDGSVASFGTVRWAADEALRRGRPLLVTHILPARGPLPEPDGSGDDNRLALDAADVARRWTHGLEVTTATRHGEAARILCEQSRDADLLVVGSRGYGGFHSLLVGSVSLHLAGHAHCPVLVVHHAERWAGPESRLPAQRPIVVGTDGSPHGTRALELAFAEAAARRVPIAAVRAWQEPEPRPGRTVLLSRLAADVSRELAADLEPWRVRYPDVYVEPRVRPGAAVMALLAEAPEALMIVIGARGHGGVPGLALGGVAQQVLEHAEVAVLVARPAWPLRNPGPVTAGQTNDWRRP